MDKMHESPIFCTTKIEEINSLIQNEIDSRLYFAAYYSPKVMSSKSNEYNFWCGVTNLYGLFKDCSIQKNLLQLFKKYDILDVGTEQKAINFFHFIMDLRSIFSHNSSKENITSSMHYKKFIKFVKEHLHTQMPNTLPYSISLSNEDWLILLKALSAKTDKYLKTINTTLEKIQKSDNKDKIISEWISLIATWYSASNVLHIVLTDTYRLIKAAGKTILSKNEWINTVEKNMPEKENLQKAYVKYISEWKDIALPFEIVSGFLNENIIE